MKTWQAYLAHMGLTAAQAAIAVPFFNPGTTGGALSNLGVQMGAQFGMAAIQLWIARKNSQTDPNGKVLTEYLPGRFTTTEPTVK